MILAQSFSRLYLVDRLTRYREVFIHQSWSEYLQGCEGQTIPSPLSLCLSGFVGIQRELHGSVTELLGERRRKEHRRAPALGRDW